MLRAPEWETGLCEAGLALPQGVRVMRSVKRNDALRCAKKNSCATASFRNPRLFLYCKEMLRRKEAASQRVSTGASHGRWCDPVVKMLTASLAQAVATRLSQDGSRAPGTEYANTLHFGAVKFHCAAPAWRPGPCGAQERAGRTRHSHRSEVTVRLSWAEVSQKWWPRFNRRFRPPERNDGGGRMKDENTKDVTLEAA